MRTTFATSVAGFDFITGDRLAGWERALGIGAVAAPLVGAAMLRLGMRLHDVYKAGKAAARMAR